MTLNHKECCSCRDTWIEHYRVEAREVIKLQEAIQRVRELHGSVPDPIAQRPDSFICSHCSDVGIGFYMMFPCPTIEALDGEQ